MMNLRSTLKLAHGLLDAHQINHALIGGLAMACYGSTRSTVDLDLLVDEKHKELTKSLLTQNGFTLTHESPEVLQFAGLGYVDIILARRPISQKILQEANPGGPEGIRYVRTEDLIGLKIQAYVNDPSREFQDKADIVFLIKEVENLDWARIKSYADLFNEWSVVDELKNQAKLG